MFYTDSKGNILTDQYDRDDKEDTYSYATSTEEHIDEGVSTNEKQLAQDKYIKKYRIMTIKSQE